LLLMSTLVAFEAHPQILDPVIICKATRSGTHCKAGGLETLNSFAVGGDGRGGGRAPPPHSQSLDHTFSHSLDHALSLFLSLILSHSHSLTLSQTLSLALSLSHSRTLSLSHTLSLSPPLQWEAMAEAAEGRLRHTLSFSLTHSHSLTHSLTLSLSL
jgi:hypothetical protein